MEALKIRVISKGPPFLYTALKPLQMWLWSQLKGNSVFELIGKPVTEETINSCIGDIGLRPDEIIISGDYKSSTDKLHSWTSECSAREIARVLRENGQFSPLLEDLLIRSLTGHIFVDEDGFKFPQKEGQLMGSISSFPFLCLANAAMCRWAMEKADGVTYRLSDKPTTVKGRIAPLRVNGDDCVFRGKKDLLVDFWEKITAFGGLETSIGKTYYSRDFCVINSVLYDFSGSGQHGISDDVRLKLGLKPRVWKWTERKYVNLGLLYGLQRSTTKESTVGIESLGTIHRALHLSCPTKVWEHTSKTFLYLHGNLLNSYKLPWFIPEWAGGVGLVTTTSRGVSLRDQLCVSAIKHDWHKAEYRPRPVSLAAEWRMHRHVMERLDKNGVGEVDFKFITPNGSCERYNIENNYAKVYKYATIETLFTHTREQLYMKVGVAEQKRVAACISHNENVWARAIKRSMKIVDLKPTPTSEMMAFPMDTLQPYVIDTQANSSAKTNLWSSDIRTNNIKWRELYRVPGENLV